MLKILGKPTSINVRKVLWTCAELDIPYEIEPYGLGYGDTRTPEFLRLNPNGMVPVVIDDGFVLWESNTICRYLANQRHATALFPVHAQARARVEQWMDWQAIELNNSWRYAFMSLVRRSAEHQQTLPLAVGMAEWNRHMVLLNEHLETSRAYAAGDGFTLADVVLGLSTHRWLMTPMTRPDLPAVSAYYKLLSARPGFTQHARIDLP
jgi:glutathione S-transferase